MQVKRVVQLSLSILLPRSGARSNVAVGTRKIVKMVAIGQDGVYNDSYADDLSLILGTNRIFSPLIRR
jgi:hypothetical protein